MTVAGTWVLPEFVLERFLAQRLAEVATENPDQTIPAIFGHHFSAATFPNATSIQQWFDRTKINVHVGDPNVFSTFPRICIHWVADAEKGFTGNLSNVETDDDGNLIYEYASEFSGDVGLSLQGFEGLEVIWIHQIILKLIMEGKHALEDLGLRGITGIRSREVVWVNEGKQGGDAIKGRMLLVPCIWTRAFEARQDTTDLEIAEDFQSEYHTDTQDDPLP